MEMCFSMSADVYSNLAIGLALKNCTKMTADTLKYVQWIISYEDVFFRVSLCEQWLHHLHWIGLEQAKMSLKSQKQGKSQKAYGHDGW